MDLTLNGDEQEIIAAAAAVMRKALPLSRLHDHRFERDPQRADPARFTAEARTLLAEQGWFGLILPTSLGGAELSVVEQMLVFRELGRGLGPLGCLNIALAAQLAASAGTSDVLTSQLLSGEREVALAVESELEIDAGGAAIGQVRAIETLDAGLLLIAEPDSAQLIDISDVGRQPRPCLDKSTSMALLDLQRAPVIARLADPTIYRAGALLTAAMLLGIAEATRDIITEYARQRQTFGRPIGAYQAVRHPCADMAVKCEVARCQLFVAAVSLRDGRADAQLQIDSAKVLATSAAIHNVDWNTQLHGGVAVMEEHDAHLYMKRAHLLSRCFGDDKVALDRIFHAPLPA